MRLSVLGCLMGLSFFGMSSASAKHHHHHDDDVSAGLANVTLLVVRHAEKPMDEGDPGLAPAGIDRANAYASYFRHFQVNGIVVPIDTLIASSDSSESARPRLTLEPLSKATGIPIQTPFANKKVDDLAGWLAAGQVHHVALIAWHHGRLRKLLEALGADPASLLPNGVWPEDVYDWVILLRYDENGRLVDARKIVEPNDLR